MKAVRVPSGRVIAPFGDPVAQVPVLNQPLAQVQEQALRDAGVELLDAPPARQPYIVFSDRTWFTADLIRRLLVAGPGRLRVDDADFWTTTGPLQSVPQPGLFEIGLLPGGGDPRAGLDALDPVTIDLGLRDMDLPVLHAAVQHAVRPARTGAALIHQVDHWTHVLRINQLALMASAERARLDWEARGWWSRLWAGMRLLWRAGALNEYAVMAALTDKAPDVKIHPSAVVEVSRLGPGVEIGAHAVVRASVLGPGVRVEEHATVVMSVLGQGCHVSRYGFFNLSTAWPGAQISHGGGYQMSLLGRDAFLAWGATGLDLSFGGPVRVEHPDHPGQRVDSGHHFLGVAIGHRARIGNAVRLHHGVAVPNDALLVASADDLLRRWDDAPVSDGPLQVRDGRPERGRPAKASRKRALGDASDS